MLRDTRGGQSTYNITLTVLCIIEEEKVSEAFEYIPVEEEQIEEEQRVRKFEKPEPYIQVFSSQGSIYLRWNVRMRMLPLQNRFQVTPGRLLTESEDEFDNAALHLEYEQNSNGIDQFVCKHSWKHPKLSVVQLTFTNPAVVSSDMNHPDVLKIVFNDTLAFISEDGERIAQDFVLEINVPRQDSGKGLTEKELKTVGSASQNVARGAVALSAILKALGN